MNRFESIERRRAEERRTFVFGSMARGASHAFSDLDLAVECPDEHRYRIEFQAQEIAGHIPVDIVYIDELVEPWRSRIVQEMRDAAGLR